MIKVDTTNALVEQTVLDKLEQKLIPEIKAMQEVVEIGGYNDDRASINLPDDEEMVKRVDEAAAPFRGAHSILLVGMGGPGLGSRAIQMAYNNLRNESIHSMELCYPNPPDQHHGRLYYADTVFGSSIRELLMILEEDLKVGRKLVVIISTQSGTTTETIANMAVFIELFEKYGIDPTTAMPIITNEGSKLYKFSQERGFTCVSVPAKVGGRYSVFSPVGLFPIAIQMDDGENCQGLVAGAREARDQSLSLSLEKNCAARNAAVIYHHYKQGKNILVNFMFDPRFETIGLWLRQVMAESLGKAHDRDGKLVNHGITPTVAIGSRDLHSMFQLYMEGPNDKFTNFIRVGSAGEVIVPKKPEIEALVTNLQGKSYSAISRAISEGVFAAYRDRSRPFSVIDLPDNSNAAIGYLLQAKMMETMFLGHLMNVNPFDQPGVELYKTEMKRILASS